VNMRGNRVFLVPADRGTTSSATRSSVPWTGASGRCAPGCRAAEEGPRLRAGREGEVEERRPREDPDDSKKREERMRLLVGRLSCLIGVLLGSGCVVSALLGVRPNVSAAVVGIGLGVVGHFLGARRLATVTVVLGVAALLIGMATIEGLIPGIEAYDQERPSAR
jgi:hypothetical protein